MAEQLKEAAAPAAGLTAEDKLRMLLEVTSRISRSLDLREVLDLVMGTLGSLIAYDAAGIYLVECPHHDGEPAADETCVLQTEAVRGYDTEEMAELTLKVG